MSDRLINIKEVCNIIGFGRTYIYTEIKKGAFPAPHKIGEKSSRWSEKEVSEWIERKKNNKVA